MDPPLARLLKLAGGDRRYTRAEGVCLYDDTGRACLDLTAGYGALNLGHNPPEVLEAVRAAQRLPAVLLVGFNPLASALAATLAAMLPGELSISIFGSGGAEAVENALKTARAFTAGKDSSPASTATTAFPLARSPCADRRGFGRRWPRCWSTAN